MIAADVIRDHGRRGTCGAQFRRRRGLRCPPDGCPLDGCPFDGCPFDGCPPYTGPGTWTRGELPPGAWLPTRVQFELGVLGLGTSIPNRQLYEVSHRTARPQVYPRKMKTS
jgi:hypothetical protein